MILRYPVVSGLALAITFSLFFVMQLLVATGVDVIQKAKPYKPIVITRVIEDEEIIRKKPALPVIKSEQPPIVDDWPIPIGPPKVGNKDLQYEAPIRAEIPVPEGPAAGLQSDRDHAIAIVAIPPRYPQSLAARGVAGHVDVRFDITKTGAVANAVVTYSTNRGFERSALQAIAKWKFQPRVVDGAPQMQFGVEKRISYVLEQG